MKAAQDKHTAAMKHALDQYNLDIANLKDEHSNLVKAMIDKHNAEMSAA